MTAPASSPSFEDLRASLSGPLYVPGDPGFEEHRRVHNGFIDCQPAAIARCYTVADVIDAVNHGRSAGLEITVRGGGHNVAGRAVSDGGLMIDLSAMKGIWVDPRASTARAQGGVTWGEFNRATQVHGLATTGGVISSTGIGGLTLGGGLGWTMGKFGLSIDNLISVEVVTAAGSVVQASAGENADLFWAVRGGGGNFGVVTSFEFALHAVGPMLTGGLLAYPISEGPAMLRFFRDLTANLPDDLSVFAGLLHAPDGSGMPICAMISCHVGTPEAAERDLAAVRAFGPPAMDALGPIPYVALNGMLDAGFPKGARNYWKSSFTETLPDEALDTLVEQFSVCPSPMSGILLEHFHGAVTRVPPEATAYPHRAQGFNFLAASQWVDSAEDSVHIAWARETFAAMEQFTEAGGYVNYLSGDETSDRVAAAYGANYGRLQQVKRAYDPSNLFHMNQNILPAP